MIPYKILYYPGFVPDTTWLRQILLLCDGVVRVVPTDVHPDDPDDLKRLQEVLSGGLESVTPESSDVAVHDADRARLARAFRMIGTRRTASVNEITLRISGGGRLSIADHVFVHDSKLSHFVTTQLKRHGLLIEDLRELAPEGFLVVQQDASDLILAGLASRIAERLGLDAITDKPMPFAYAALRGVPSRTQDAGIAEGALLASLARAMIPTEVASVDLRRYREIRASYTEIRQAFKRLTSELATLHRVTRVGDSHEFLARVDSIARAYDREYQLYRKSAFARRLTRWTPLYVGGALSVGVTLVDPLLAIGMTVGSVAIQVVQELLKNSGGTKDQRVFNLLSGLRRDIVKASGIRELV